jgi:YD repeat-containing protein
MNEAEKICDEIQKALPKISPGTLRFWGVWFGRPYDNAHRIVASEHDRGVLRLRFNEDERLTVWSPAGLMLDSSVFQIDDAERVLWEWFSYVRPKTQENLYFYDFVKTPETIVASSNVDWFTPNMKTDSTLPAAEILSIRINVKSP